MAFIFASCFAFVFSPSPLKLIKCNIKQWWNSVLLSSMFKFWVFAVFIASFVIFWNFLRWNFSKFSQYIWSHPAKHEKSRLCKGSFYDIFKFLSYRCQKTIDFPRKRAPTKVKYLLLKVCQIFRNITEEKARKFNVSFAFCAHAGVIKYRKTLTFSFERAQITWAFVVGALAIVRLYAIPDINFIKRGVRHDSTCFTT